MLSSLMSASTGALSADAAAQFYAGYVWGVKAEDKRNEIVGCFKTDTDLNTMLDTIMADYKKGDTKDADSLWEKADPHFAVSLQKCTKDSIYDEYKDLDKYTKDVMNRKDAKDFLEARYKKYKAMIDQRAGFMIDSWTNGVYFDAGMYNGQINQYMGLVKSPYDEELEADKKRDELAPGKFLAGWLYGISGRTLDARDAITKCFTANDDLTNDVYDGMEAYIAGDQSSGDKDWIEARKLFPQALAKCDSDITDALVKWSKKMDEMVHMHDWDNIEEKIYEAHKDVVDFNAKNSYKTWTEGVPFQSGMFIGENDKIFLDATKDNIAVFHPFF